MTNETYIFKESFYTILKPEIYLFLLRDCPIQFGNGYFDFIDVYFDCTCIRYAMKCVHCGAISELDLTKNNETLVIGWPRHVAA